MDRLYSFVMRGELAKVSLSYTEALSKHHSSDIIVQDYIESLSLDLLDDEYISSSKLMATVYTAISAFENTIREFVVKILIENKGENWWEDCVSEKIRNKAETRKEQEDKVN